MMEYAMELNLNEKTAGQAAGAAFHDIDRQRLRILRCTAQAMASSPGGLRFKAGTRPWLEGLPVAERRRGRGGHALARPAA
jgi:hypothetical protein